MTGVMTEPVRPAAPSAPEKPWYKREYHIGRPVKIDEVMNFSRQAASFLRAGIPVLDALTTIAEESSSNQMREVLADIHRRIRSGESLGLAISHHPRVFPGYYIAMVRSAELTGQLDDVFEQLSTYLERDIEARRQVKSALTYPAFVMGLSLVAVVVMSAWVLPKFKDMYSSLGADLPLPTRILLGITDFMTSWWFAIVGAIVVLFALGYLLIGGKHGKRRRDALLFKIPVISPLVRLIVIERFCRVLSALVNAGVMLPDAVHVASESTNHRGFQRKMTVAREAMIRGEGLSRPITATGMFPAAARQMIRVGESSGTLDRQLVAAAEFYERELRFRLKRATDLFEPIVIVVVGLVVGFVALAQVSAMYSVFNQIQ